MVPIQKASAKFSIEMILPWKNESIQFSPKEIAEKLFDNRAQYYSFGGEPTKKFRTRFEGLVFADKLVEFLVILQDFQKTHKNLIDIDFYTVWN